MPDRLDYGEIFAGALVAGWTIIGAFGAWKGWPIGVTDLLFPLAGALAVLLLFRRRLNTFSLSAGTKGITLSGKLDPEVTAAVKATGLDGATSLYAFVHRQLGNDPATQAVKIELQDRVVELVRAQALSQPVSADDAAAAIRSGPPAARVLSFGLLAADPSLATVDLLITGIRESLSGNEQYWALRAAQAAWDNLGTVERQRVKDAVNAAPFIGDDGDRAALADELRTRT
jgi:hypothetical protein